jgi:DNA-binding MarR family transcriptional regulator
MAVPTLKSKGAAVTAKRLPTNSLIYEIARQWRVERPDLDLQNFLMQIYLQRIGRIIESRFGKMCLRRFGVRAQDMRLLFALRRSGAPFAKRPTDLFRATLVTSGAITKQVDRLANKRLVRRLPDPDYGGGFLVQLTEKGLEIIDGASTMVATESFIGPAMAAMKPSERDAAERFCLRLIATLEAADSESGDNPASRRPARPVARKRRSKSAPNRRARA